MTTNRSLSVELSAALPEDARATVAVGVFTDDPRLPAAEALGGRLRALCERVVAEGEFEGEEETTLLLHAAASGEGDESRGGESGGETRGALRVLLVGLGPRADSGASVLRRAAGAAVRAAHTRALSFVVPEVGGLHHRYERRAA